MKKIYMIIVVFVSFIYAHGSFSLAQFRNSFNERCPNYKVSIYGIFDTTQFLDSIKVILPKEIVTIVKEEGGRTDEELIDLCKHDVFSALYLTFYNCDLYSNPSLVEDHFNPKAKIILIIKGVKRTYALLADWIKLYNKEKDLAITSGTTGRTDEEYAEFQKNEANSWK